MKNTILKALLIGVLFNLFSLAHADEGMWLIHLLNKNLSSQMKKTGLKIDPKIIYDQDNASISDAIVALDFGCTGSIISKEGLLLTNHHCAYGDIHSLSTPEKNYLEDGFWAMTKEQEIPIKGKSAFFLRKVIDATQEVHQVSDSLKKEGFNAGMRKISSIIERRYKKGSGSEVMLMSMWRGTKYYLFFYDVYSDIRLVGAPPVSIAAYGGDYDNWEWPQHKGDFTLYRIYSDKDGKPAQYSKENIPLKPKKVLSISTKGVKEGDFTMVIGFPGRTNRYSSSFGVNEKEKITNPISVKVKGERLRIMNRFMNQDPNVRLIYADNYFGISNVQELLEGEIYNFRRFGVVDIKRDEERLLREWINKDSKRAEKWGDLLERLEESYKSREDITKAKKYYQETLVSGQGFIYFGNRANSLRNIKEREGVDTIKVGSKHQIYLKNLMERGYQSSWMPLEKELMNYQLDIFFKNVENQYWGEYLTELHNKFKGDAQKITNFVFGTSNILNKERFYKLIEEDQPIDLFINDPISQLAKSARITSFNQEEIDALEDGLSINALEAEYTRALYKMREEMGIEQYPDANSTMRITYGTIGPLIPSDGKYYSSQTTYRGILDKYNPDSYEFSLKPKMKELLKNRDWGQWGKNNVLYINFLSNNDITGGNSGSPVLNSKGEIIGLAFDGNKESLASDAYFHPDMNKCINVDIRYVLWIIDKYANAQHILKEIL